MADDYQDLGGLEVFPFRPNWLKRPESSHLFARRLLQHPGTLMTVSSLTDWSPDTWQAMFQIDNKDDEYDLLDFFYSRRGKHERFWVEHPAAAFLHKDDTLTGALEIYMQRNKANLAWQGGERVYIEMTSNDIVTRKVTDIVENVGSDRLELTVATAMDRDLTSTNHNMVGKFLLVRFSTDNMIVEHYTNNVLQVKLQFVELVEEYDDV